MFFLLFVVAAIAASIKPYDSYKRKVSVGSLVPKNSPFTVNVTSVYDATKGTNQTVVVGNDKFTMLMGNQYGTKLMWAKDAQSERVDLVGTAVGFYASYQGAQHDLNYTSISVDSSDTMVDIALYAYEGEHHLVLFKGSDGFYSYFVNHNLPELGEFRTLIRLNPELYQNGHTSVKDGALPKFPEDYQGTKVADETWLNADGTYTTKYDWSNRLHEEPFYGVYGDYNNRSYGFWLVAAGRDYFTGDNLKQELLLHRESRTGDVVLLNMLHGTHFSGSFSENFPDGKMWGPYLFYFNEGSVSDAHRRYAKEVDNWPYQWLNDRSYLSRGTIKGRILFQDGTPAGNLNVFLGATNNYTMVQGAAYQYSSYTDEQGYFSVANVRADEQYYLQAFSSEWAGKTTKSGDTVGNFTLSKTVSVRSGSTNDLGRITWNFGSQKTIWQIGTYDRTTIGFKYGAAAYEDFHTELCPGDLDFYVGEMPDYEWCYVKSKNGTWNVHFATDTVKDATLYVSFAGYTGSKPAYIGGNSSFMSVTMNGHSLDRSQTTLLNDASTYRSSSFAGNWYYNHLPVPKNYLKKGNNTLAFTTKNGVINFGAMWDSVKLVWD